jgi:hypothetical protein
VEIISGILVFHSGIIYSNILIVVKVSAVQNKLVRHHVRSSISFMTNNPRVELHQFLKLLVYMHVQVQRFFFNIKR